MYKVTWLRNDDDKVRWMNCKTFDMLQCLLQDLGKDDMNIDIEVEKIA